MTKKTKSNKTTLAEQAKLKSQEHDAQIAVKMEGTTAGEIWKEIKDKSIDMFALPEQIVQMYCHPVFVDPERLFLTLTSTAVLPSLETAIGKKYVVELSDKYTIISRAKQ